MCTKSNPMNRVVAINTIDCLFYEPRNAKRCHRQAYKLFTFPLYGICKESNRNYLKMSPEAVKTNPLPQHLRNMLRLDILLVKAMPLIEVAKVLRWLCYRVAEAIETAKRTRQTLNAETILRYLEPNEAGKGPVEEA